MEDEIFKGPDVEFKDIEKMTVYELKKQIIEMQDHLIKLICYTSSAPILKGICFHCGKMNE